MAEAKVLPLIFNKELRERIKLSKVLVVGAGGIGCELLKNLVLSGFEDIEVIDLDTIDVSNLNRQFLFHKKHVGMSKAQVAKDSVLKFNPNAKVIAHHASVMSPDFGVGYIKNFNLVMNALDNRAARNHVNRLCLAAGVPLIESGTAGYSGQVELISKNLTSCYECTPKTAPKSFPGCTIRNTPSELIHCIVWGKHLFNQLFGENDSSDEDTDVSPDPTDPEAGGGDAATKRIPMRDWAKETGYDGSKLFTKLFLEDINVLLSMKKLWENRRPPNPLTVEAAKGFVAVAQEEDTSTPRMKEQKLWSIAECTDVFMNSISQLKKALEESAHGYLVWDKDDKGAMEFVAATANIRAFIFGIKQDSLFQIKSMAGNIIPAIATSNAVIAGLIVLNAVNVLRGQPQQCQSVYLREQPGFRGFLISREVDLVQPNPDCTTCSEKPMVTIATDLSKMKLKDFESLVLKDKLNMIEPEVILTRTGNMILSSEEGEAEDLKDRTLQDLGVNDGSLLEADDFLQNYKIMIVAQQRELARNDPPFYVLQKSGDFNPRAENTENGGTDGVMAGPSKEAEDDDDDCLMVLDGVEQPRKRKPENNTPVPVKKRKTDDKQREDDEDIIIL